jgi:hypothetical protein
LAGFTWDDNDDDDASLYEAPEFGEHDFDDPGSSRWERLEDWWASWKWFVVWGESYSSRTFLVILMDCNPVVKKKQV